MKELNSFKELFTWNKEEQQDLEFENLNLVTAVYSATGVLNRLNESIQAVPYAVDLSKYPEITAPFVFVNGLAKPLSNKFANLDPSLLAWPWITTDAKTVVLDRTEELIKGVIQYNGISYWCSLKATVDFHKYEILTMSEIKPGFDIEYYRHNFVVMEEHNRTSYVNI